MIDSFQRKALVTTAVSSAFQISFFSLSPFLKLLPV